MLSEGQAKEYVSNGAAWLDKEKSDWINKISLPRLDMGCCLNCMLGQLFGTYFTACETFGPEHNSRDQWAVEKGFYTFGEDAGWKILQEAWTTEIIRRKAALEV